MLYIFVLHVFLDVGDWKYSFWEKTSLAVLFELRQGWHLHVTHLVDDCERGNVIEVLQKD